VLVGQPQRNRLRPYGCLIETLLTAGRRASNLRIYFIVMLGLLYDDLLVYTLAARFIIGQISSSTAILPHSVKK
jgi:hypothetical protein